MWPFGKSSEDAPSRQSKWDSMQHRRDKAETDFFKAIKTNNLQEMEDILGAYPDLLVCLSPKGRPVLHYAIAENSLESFKFLLEKKASTDITHDYSGWSDEWGYSINVLSAVCYRKKKDFVFAYLERRGMDTTLESIARSRGEENSEIKAYLANAAQIRADYLADQKLKSELALEKKVEEKLEDKQASLDAVKKDFFAAIKSENLVLLEKTIQEHPEAFKWQEEKTGLECLFYAMEVRKIESFRALIHLGADVNEKRDTPNKGAYPTHFATKANLPDFLTILLQRGADVSNRCGWYIDYFDPGHIGRTAMEIAAALDNKKILGLLNNAEQIRADYLATHQAEVEQKTAPVVESPAPAAAQPDATKPAALDPLQKLMKEFNEMKKKQAETEKQLAETRRELAELKDPGAIVKLPRKEM